MDDLRPSKPPLPPANDGIHAFDYPAMEDWAIVEVPMTPLTAKRRVTLIQNTMVPVFGFDLHRYMLDEQGAKAETRRLMAALRRQEVPGTTLGNYTRSLNLLAAFAGYPDAKVKTPKEEDPIPKAYNTAEFGALRTFRYPKSREHEAQLRAVMHAAYTLAMRPGELCHLRLSNLDEANSRVWVERPSKGGWRRWLPVEAEFWSPQRPFMAWVRRLEALDLPSDHIFWGLNRTQKPMPASARTFRNWMNKYVGPAIQVDAEMHRFRHTRAAALHRAGMDILFIKEYLGHRRLETTYHYLRSLVGGLTDHFRALSMPGYFSGSAAHDGANA